eukprot:gene3198-6313_t
MPLSQCQSGYPHTLFLESVDKLLILCSICDKVLNEPMQCKGGHLYCKSCVLDLLSRCNTCPTCHIETTENDLSLNLFVKNLVQSFQIKCSTSITETIIDSGDGVCQWTGPLSSLNSHLQECGHVSISCENDGCNESIERRFMANHMDICPYRWESCKYCSNPFIFLDLEDHMFFCPCRPIKCNNDDCEQMIRMIDLESHRSECPWEIVQCPLSLSSICTSTCPHVLLRKDLEYHLSSKSVIHVCVNTIAELCQENKLLKNELNQIKISSEQSVLHVINENKVIHNEILNEKLRINQIENNMNENKLIYEYINNEKVGLENKMNEVEVQQWKNNLEGLKFHSDISKIFTKILNNPNIIINNGPKNMMEKWLGIISIKKDSYTLFALIDQLENGSIDNIQSQNTKIRHILWEIPNFQYENNKCTEWIVFNENELCRIKLHYYIDYLGFLQEVKGLCGKVHIIFTLLRLSKGQPHQINCRHTINDCQMIRCRKLISIKKLLSDGYILEEDGNTLRMIITIIWD